MVPTAKRPRYGIARGMYTRADGCMQRTIVAAMTRVHAMRTPALTEHGKTEPRA